MFEAGVVGHIAGRSERPAPQGLHRGSGGAHLFRATAGGDDIRSRLSERPGESQPDAAGSADYDGGLVLEFEKRMTHEEVRCGTLSDRQSTRSIGELYSETAIANGEVEIEFAWGRKQSRSSEKPEAFAGISKKCQL